MPHTLGMWVLNFGHVRPYVQHLIYTQYLKIPLSKSFKSIHKVRVLFFGTLPLVMLWSYAPWFAEKYLFNLAVIRVYARCV